MPGKTRAKKTRYYNDLLSPEDQVDAEEAIAAILFHDAEEASPLDEEAAGRLGREILVEVLWRFRPDLFEKRKRRKVTS